MAHHIIDLVDLSKDFDGEEALKNINLYIRNGEFLTLLGPSGCGKTTMLRLIAGFETPSSGKVYIDGKDVTDVPAYKRKVNTVFQKYALFPHLNVYDNVAFGLKLKKLDKKIIDKKVREMLSMVDLSGYENRSVEALSGGQQQRVAIARALVSDAPVILADEPTGNLDEDTAAEITSILKENAHDFQKCVIVVTHNSEVAKQADVVFKMNHGKVEIV